MKMDITPKKMNRNNREDLKPFNFKIRQLLSYSGVWVSCGPKRQVSQGSSRHQRQIFHVFSYINITEDRVKMQIT